MVELDLVKHQRITVICDQADYTWDERFHYYTPPQRVPEFYKNWRNAEDMHKPLYQNYWLEKHIFYLKWF